MAFRWHDWQSRFEQAPFQCGSPLLMAVTFDAARSEVADAGESTGGENSDVVKMKPGAQHRRKSISIVDPAM